MSQSRRLAAILAADVVGYSRLMGADEEGTLERLKALRHEVIDPNIEKYRGRIVKTIGDGFLIEFASVVDAVRCAAEVQQAMPGRNAGTSVDRRIELRMGINLGDVIADGDDLYGDGVNIAARIEALADAGGVFVSGPAYDQVRDRLSIGFEDLGEQQVKNIARPVRVYRVLLDEASPAPGKTPLPLPDKPSIAVLAFTNMSGDPEQEYFSDGVADDIITELSRSRSLFVIARSSSFTYKGRAVDVKRVARELGVRYVLEGSVRRGGGRVRIVTQLIDAETGNHIWAERYDHSLESLFAVQDEITTAVVTAIQPAVAEAEVRRALRKPPGNLGAWEFYQRGIWHMGKCNPTDNKHAQEFFHRALAQDVTLERAQAALAVSLFLEGGYGTRLTLDANTLARTWAQRACEADPSDADAQAILAIASLVLQGDFDDALDRIALALASNSNSFWANAAEGTVLTFSGRPIEGRAALLRAERLSPHDPSGAFFPNVVIISYYFERDYSNATARAKRAISRFPEYPLPYRWLAAALGQLGRIDEAREALRSALAISPQAYASLVHAKPPWFRPEDYEHMLDGLRKAGWQGSSE